MLTSAAAAAAGKPEKVLAVLAMFGGMSLLAFATNIIRSSRWARTRQQQLDAVAERVVGALGPR